MPESYLIFFYYIFIINLIAVAVTVSDKRRAVRHRWRVPESTLLFLSVLGGSPGMFLTMHLIRHKTQRKKFMVGIPVILILQLAAVGIWFYFVRQA